MSELYYIEQLTLVVIKRREGSYRTNKTPAGDMVQELGMKQERSGRIHEG